MPLRAEFLKSPMIRATPVTALNDPFEGRFNKKQVQDADLNQRAYYKNNGEMVEDADDYMIKESMGVIQSDFLDLGILSFTEDYNNQLMWAHYANEHKGMVVEFDFNQPFFMDSLLDLDGRKSRFGKSFLGDVFEFPEKVNYRREMPDFERAEFSSPDTMDEFHWTKFNKAILFTKANDWIYEKEQRSVVRLSDADSIICNDDAIIRKVCARDPDITLLEKNGKIQITYPFEYEMHEEMGDERIKEEISRLAFNYAEPPIHLFRINPSAISAVYFGCKAQHQDALESIKSNPSLAHLKNIYKMCVNDSRYHFDAIKMVEIL